MILFLFFTFWGRIGGLNADVLLNDSWGVDTTDEITHKIRTEKLIAFYLLSSTTVISVRDILAEIHKELPSSDWTLARVSDVKSRILELSHVPIWFHEILANFDETRYGPLSPTNQELVDLVRSRSRASEIKWMIPQFTRFMIRQWLRYCIIPLRQSKSFRFRGPICSMKIRRSGDGNVLREWALSKNMRDAAVSEMAQREYDRALARTAGRPIPEIPAGDIDILDF